MPKPDVASPGFTSLSLLLLFLVAGFFWIALQPLQPPLPAPADSQQDLFSAERALRHLQKVARAPHPTGSAENARVRDYIVGRLSEMGLEPEVQTATALRVAGRQISGATVHNVVGHLAGQNKTAMGVMLSAHYDSVPSGPGASDDGSGVAVLLETARALQAGPRLQNDVVFVFSDGEELGLLGAQAFVDGNDWAHKVAAVLNFEARGTSGPSIMFEVNQGTGAMIGEFAAAASRPVAASFMEEFYKRMPNRTDFTVYRAAGISGLNFAYAGGWAHYHTMMDNVGNTDPRSLQHDGDNALALARRLGNRSRVDAASGDTVYFNMLGRLILYPQSWVIPAILAIAAGFFAVVGLGLWNRRLRIGGMALGAGAWLVGTLIAAAGAEIAWRVLRTTPVVSLLPYGVAYNSDIYAAAFMSLAVTSVTAAMAAVRSRSTCENLTVGVLFWWLAASLVTSLSFPGGSYLFVWPLAVSLPALWYRLTRKSYQSEAQRVVVWALPVLVAVLLFAPLPYILLTVLTTGGLIPLAVSTAMLVGFLHPLIYAATSARRWWFCSMAALITVGTVGWAASLSGFDANHPAADVLAYRLDADTRQAEWISSDPVPDAWTSRFLGESPSKRRIEELGPGAPAVLYAPARAVSHRGPDLTVLSNDQDGDNRILRLLIQAPQGARGVWVDVGGTEVQEVAVEGRGAAIRVGEGMRLYYAGIPEKGLELKVKVPATARPEVRVTSQSDGLPEVPGMDCPPRPDRLMPAPWPLFNSSTLIARTFSNLITNIAPGPE